MNKLILFLILLIPIANAITLETGTILSDGTYNYTLNKNITDISASINQSVGEIYFDGIKFCDYGHRDRLTTLRTCPGETESDTGGGSPSESEKPPGNIEDNCKLMNGTLIQDEEGNPLCILDEDTPFEIKKNIINQLGEYINGPYEGLIKVALILGGALVVFLYITKVDKVKDEKKKDNISKE